MDKRLFGKTGLQVTPLGFGTAELGFLDIAQSDCDHLLNGVLDAGITLVDTAECYGAAELKVGTALSHRRGDFVLVTKCGHHSEEGEPPEWSPEGITGSAERSLRRLKTDHVDVLLLHSCSLEDLKREDLIAAFFRIKERGLARFVGYSGDNEALEYAIKMGVFDCIETSLSLCDQINLEGTLARAAADNLGVLIKRPLANSVWRDMTSYGSFYDEYTAPYTQRFKAMNLSTQALGFEGDWLELALRFTAYQAGVHTAIIGGKNLSHICEDVTLLGKGALPPGVVEGIRKAWKGSNDGNWKGET
jgi:aryl-alcohol dehydrogenase-like predicted oxidoreductase